MLGPVDYVVIGFRGNNFDGSIVKELQTAVKNNLIRVIDLLFIMRDKQGDVVEGEYEDQSPELRASFGEFDYDPDMPILSESDIAKIGSQMENDTAAGVLVIEHVWAKDLKKALMDAGGFLVADGRIHPGAVESAMDDLHVAVA
jgi:hypothetical protein